MATTVELVSAAKVITDHFHIQDEETPARFIQALSELLLCADNPLRFPFKTFPSTSRAFVYKGCIRIASVCPHHLLPYLMNVYIGYLPRGKVLGVSKITRLARYCAARPILQEELTEYILKEMQAETDSPSIYCLIDGLHLCEVIRGARGNALTTTYNHLGNNNHEQLFHSLVNADRAKATLV